MSGLSLVAFVLFAADGAAGQAHFPSEGELNQMLQYLVEDAGTPGIVMGVIEADGSTRIVSQGRADSTGRPVGPDSRFEIGSITKTFTATLLADMVLRGQVALEDPVAKYLPAHVQVPTYDGRQITLLDLATHRSGLPSTPDDLGNVGVDNSDVRYTVEDAYAFLSDYDLPRAPGARFEYSNFGFGLLGHALGLAAGSGYRELVHARILEPLGMRATGFARPAVQDDGSVDGHRRGEPVRYRTDLEIFDGAGALVSSAADMVRYLAAQLGPPATDLERAMRLTHEIRFTAGGRGSGQGLAWSTIGMPGEADVVTHSGGTPGFRSAISFAPDSGIGAIVLANDAFFKDNIATTLLYFGQPDARETVAVPASTLARYAGEYVATAGDGRFYVRLEDGGFLTYQPGGLVRVRLYARSDSVFYMLRGPWTLTFRADADEGVTMIAEVDEREPGQRTSRHARKVKDETPPPADVAHNRTERAASPLGVVALLVGGIALTGALLLRRRGRRSDGT